MASAVEEDRITAVVRKQLSTEDEQQIQKTITLFKSKEKIMKSQQQFPQFIKIAERSRGLITAHLDSAKCHLVAGFNTSVVKMWQLDHQACMSKHLYRGFTDQLCTWEVNNCLEEDADQIDVDIQERLKNKHNRTLHAYYEAKDNDNSYNEYGGIELRGHGRGVTDVRFSQKHNLIFSVSKDSTMRCWRAESYSCASVYNGHRYPIWCLAESPTGAYIATGSRDMTARLWSLDREFPMRTYVGHSEDVECIDFHPTGTYLATGSADSTVRMYCVDGGNVMRIFVKGIHPITSIAFSPDGKFIATADDKAVRIFDLAAAAQLHELKTLSSNVSSLAWSGCSQHLAAVSTDGSFRMWNVNQLNDSSQAHSRVSGSTGNCQRLVKVMFGKNDNIYCIGA